MPRVNEQKSITIHVTGDSNAINLGTVLGDVRTSVKMLSETDHKDMAVAIDTFASTIHNADELDAPTKREYLEHLATVAEQVAKPPEQRRIATFTNALSNLGSIATVATKLAPVYDQLVALLKAHDIIS
jgi:hypothetical protein